MGRNDEAEALERLRDLADETIAQVRRIPKEASQAAGGAKQARQHADRARERAALASAELAAHARAINLQEQAAALQERLGHPDPGPPERVPMPSMRGSSRPGA